MRLGPWQNQEIQALLSQFVKRKCPVIPVVLPSAKTTPHLPWTLGGETARVGGKGAPTAQPTAKNFALKDPLKSDVCLMASENRAIVGEEVL